MTVLQLVSSEGYYGVESMLVALAGALARCGCDSIVGAFRDSRRPHTEVAEQARREGIPAETVTCDGRWDWKAVVRLRHLLAGRRVDVLHTHGYKADLYGWMAAWPDRVALLATAHNWPSRLLSMRAYAALDRMALKRFDKVVAPSPVVANLLSSQGIEVTRLFNGVDLERFRGAEPTLRREIASGAERLVGYVGRLVPGKGGAVLLSAAQSVLGGCPDVRFVFVGEGPSRGEWEALAARLGIARNVVFTGARNDMPSVYASLDLLVLPSFDEAMPMCLLEGMAAGVPVIATRVGAVSDLVLPDVTGLLLEPGDASGLAAAILRLLLDPHQARSLGEGGRARATWQFSAEATAKSYIELYEQALAGRASRMRRRCDEQEQSA